MDNKDKVNNQEEQTSNEKIEIILPDAKIEMTISTGFYQRMNNIVSFLVEGKSQKELEDAQEQIKARDIKESWVAHMQTIYIFLREFQKVANESGFVKNLTQDEIGEVLTKFQLSKDKDFTKNLSKEKPKG